MMSDMKEQTPIVGTPLARSKPYRTQFVRDIAKCIFPRKVCKQGCVIDSERKLIFLPIPKTGNASIKQTFRTTNEIVSDDLQKTISKRHGSSTLPADYSDYYIFSFVRNPFDRLYSCYKHKLGDPSSPFARRYLFTTITGNETFAEFVHKVCRIPDKVADRHFCSQSFLLTDRNNQLLPAFVGAFEKLDEDFSPIQKRFNLASLPHVHKTGGDDWTTVYTPELATLVYDRYREDCERFNYTWAAEKLGVTVTK